MKSRGENAVCDWIDHQLEGTTVTAILIGRETADRDYVHYEIDRSIDRGNGFVAIYIHDMLDQYGGSDWFRGRNPLEDYDDPGATWPYWSTLADRYGCYDWLGDDGYSNFGDWVEDAYQRARD